MNASEYILSKQIQWAHNSNIKLIGSKKVRGRLAYTRSKSNFSGEIRGKPSINRTSGETNNAEKSRSRL